MSTITMRVLRTFYANEQSVPTVHILPRRPPNYPGRYRGPAGKTHYLAPPISDSRHVSMCSRRVVARTSRVTSRHVAARTTIIDVRSDALNGKFGGYTRLCARRASILSTTPIDFSHHACATNLRRWYRRSASSKLPFVCIFHVCCCARESSCDKKFRAISRGR